MSLGNKLITSVVTWWIISTVCMTSISAFTIHTATPFATKSPLSSSTSLPAKEKNKISIDLTNIPERGSGNLLEKFFTGGAFEDDSATNLAEAVKIASRIKSAKDLGWTKPPKRRGNTKPRHRAWGGESELSVQDKPNYDETKEKCVEKWLTLEDFQAKTKSSGPASDTAFVALAGGAKYAEREVCEELITQWRPGNKFDEAAFEKSVKAGQTALLTGWGAFLSVTTFFASCIVFPTNPASKFFEGLIGKLLEQ